MRLSVTLGFLAVLATQELQFEFMQGTWIQVKEFRVTHSWVTFKVDNSGLYLPCNPLCCIHIYFDK